MKVSYKQIRRVTPVIVDDYYGCTMDDFLDDDQCAEINAQWIREKLERAEDIRKALAPRPLNNCVYLFRKEAHLTQRQLAEMVGLSVNAISAIERGRFGCSAYTAALLCAVFQCDFEELFYL